MLRLGLDIGTNSIGWCLTEDDSIRDIGVRIFSNGRDPQSGTSLAVDRRDARSARRRRDRYIGRRSAFLDALVAHGLMPADAEEAKLVAARDPYALRAKALKEALRPHEIGRALFHLNQRRGFKSNRKAERKTKDADDGKIASGEQKLNRAMANAEADTLGEFLFKRQTMVDEQGKPAPLAARVRGDSDGQGYEFYPQRRHIEYEFCRIWEVQAKHHPDLLNETARAALHRILFFQRPLKAQEVGICTFVHSEYRLAKAHPLFQQRRLYEEVNQLEVTTPGESNRKLTLDERNTLVLKLKAKKAVAFDSLAKLLKLEPGQSFNKASETRTQLAGDEVRAAMGDPKRFGARWDRLDSAHQWTILEQMIDEEDPDALHAFLIGEGLDEAHADAVAKTSLPEGYGRLGSTATTRILAELKAEVITYDVAVQRCGWHHSDDRTGEVLPQLPYYGELLTRDIPPGTQEPSDPPEKRWGRITNPTVHIGLNQLQKLVNAIVRVHGRPDEIVVELARELKLNDRDKDEHDRRIRRDTLAAQARSRKLTGLDEEGNQVGERIAPDTGANRMLLRIWEDSNLHNCLDRRCPYCGKPIGIQMLFGAQGVADIDHIIPYSRSLDDSVGNKVVAHRACNQAKGNMTPWEKWGGTERWDTIAEQVARMHTSKQWRFRPDAMERVERDGGFIARQLKDTQYLSRIAGRYLSSLYPESGPGSRHVFMNTGRLTAMLRRLWALNDILEDSEFVDNKNSNAAKNRLDHRHHAIDAFVMAVIDPGLIARVAHAARRAEDKNLDRMFDDLPEPWPGYLPELQSKLLATVVSHKPDHGRKGKPAPRHDTTSGKLHDDTAYGLTGDVGVDGRTPVVVKRVAFASLAPKDIADPERIRDAALRTALQDATAGRSGKDFEAALVRFARTHPVFAGIRHVRVLGERAATTTLDVIPIADASGRAYKAYKGNTNARFQVWRMPDGSWKHTTVSTFRAHQPTQADTRPHPAAKKILDLRQNDLIAIERNARAIEIVRVVKFSASGQVTLAAHNESGNLKARDSASNDVDPFKYVSPTAGGLKKIKARQVRIDPLGRLFDPGPR